MQRLRLSAQLGSGLTGALYVLDEPTIGLHPRDTRRLLATCAARGHGLDGARRRARRRDDPRGRPRHRSRSGRRTQRGHIVAEGPAAHVLVRPALADRASARRDRAHRAPEAPDGRRVDRARGRARAQPPGRDFRVPSDGCASSPGVSGSGKSTLVRHVFYPALRRALEARRAEPGASLAQPGTRP
jgi:excinuclease ABC subunit A